MKQRNGTKSEYQVSVAECAARLGMCKQTFRKLAREGKFPFAICASGGAKNRIYIIREHFEGWLANGKAN